MRGKHVSYQKVDKHSRRSHKLKFSVKSLTFSCLICALNLYIFLKSCSHRQNLLQVARAAKSCSNVAEHNWDRPITFCRSNLFLIVKEAILISHLSRRPRKRSKTTRLVNQLKYFVLREHRRTEVTSIWWQCKNALFTWVSYNHNSSQSQQNQKERANENTTQIHASRAGKPT